MPRGQTTEAKRHGTPELTKPPKTTMVDSLKNPGVSGTLKKDISNLQTEVTKYKKDGTNVNDSHETLKVNQLKLTKAKIDKNPTPK